jgi:beta-galactosidase
MQDFRIKALKSFGCNAIRCSHNPPTPEFLDACDRLGVFVIDENRLMGVTDYHLNELKQMILRDRNHPCIIAWSIGNEEWNMENTITGARVAATMQAYAKTIDSTRYITAAISGSLGHGIPSVMDLLGYNYIANKNTDEQHKEFPNQFSWGTEEGATVVSRGIYVDDKNKHQIAAYDRKRDNSSSSIEEGWKYYAQRPYLAGMFIWTGFDYRGEPTPFGWPSIYSYHGMLDACGFAKDDVWYLKSWWTNQNVLHVFPHWNWKGKEGQNIQVWVYSNSDEVELFLNKKSLGKKTMPKNGHLEWAVAYEPGKLEAIGYKAGKKVATDVVETTGNPAALEMTADRSLIKADKEDVSVIKIQAKDKKGLAVPTADSEIAFTIQGPGKIIGVGNGDETSLEPDKYLETVTQLNIENLKEKIVENVDNRPEVVVDFDDVNWEPAFKNFRFPETAKAIVYRGSFRMPESIANAAITLFYTNIGKTEAIYINGQQIVQNSSDTDKEFKIEPRMLRSGKNIIAIVAVPFIKKNSWDYNNTNPGTMQLIAPAAQWKRKLFNGLAEVIVQSTGEAGEIVLTATSKGLKSDVIRINAAPVVMRNAVASVEK